jgi:hypothetical protein
MSGSYLPVREALLAAWAVNFSTLLTATPADFGLLAPDAVTVAGVVNDFSAALTAATNPATRTSITIDAKDTAKAAMVNVLRRYAMRIKMDETVADEDKLAIGVGIRDFVPTPIAAPVTFPMVNVAAAGPLTHELRFADNLTPDSRAKPAGAIGMQLFRSVGVVPPGTPLAAQFLSFVTKQPYTSSFVAGDLGKTAYYYARWQTRTGLVGPWSVVSSFVIAG